MPENPPSISISKAQISTLEMLRSFAERTFRTAYAAENDPVRFEEYCEKAFSTAQFRVEFEHPDSEFWLAWEAETLVGYLKLNYDEQPEALVGKKTVQVERIYVDPLFQGRRYGEKLMDFVFQQAVAKDAEWVWLGVWQANPAALRFYERCGFEIFGTAGAITF